MFSTMQTDCLVSLHFMPDCNFKIHVLGYTLLLHFSFSIEKTIKKIHKQFASGDTV